MKPVNYLDPVALEAALRRAERLWPDPSQAPEVPPRGLLKAYLSGADLLPREFRGWLSVQISESVNCQRALEMLRAEMNPDHPMHRDDSERIGLLRKSWEYFKIWQSTTDKIDPISSPASGSEMAVFRDAPAEPSIARHAKVAVEQLWTTEARVERFNGQGLETRMTWRPVEVLIAEGPFQDLGETFWRAIPCTPLWAWGEDNVGAEESIIRIAGADDYVAHFLLEYPVSESQLHARVGTAEDFEIVPGSAPATPELILERERIYERASWLTAALDARREAWEANPARARGVVPPTKEWGWEIEALGLESVSLTRHAEPSFPARWQFRATMPPSRIAQTKIHESIALAAKTPGGLSSQALVFRGRPEEVVKEIPRSAGLQSASPKSAKILLEPSETSAFSGPAFAQWDVSELVPPSFPPCQLIVLSPALDSILATGHVRDGKATALGCDWEESRKTIDQWEDWVLLIFDQSQ